MNVRAYRKNGHITLLHQLKEHIEAIESQSEYFRQQVNEWNKDSEIQRLKEENDRLKVRSVHILSDKEESDLREFRNEHYNSCKSATEEIISHSGIGSGITVRCVKCGTKKNITDTDMW
jgi:hypothetical protein